MSAVTTAPRNFNFPLTAIVGQESIKLALLLAVIDPELGGEYKMFIPNYRGVDIPERSQL